MAPRTRTLYNISRSKTVFHVVFHVVFRFTVSIKRGKWFWWLIEFTFAQIRGLNEDPPVLKAIVSVEIFINGVS